MNRIELPLVSRTALKARYRESEATYRELLDRVVSGVRRTLEVSHLHPTIRSRVKSFDSLYAKLVGRARMTGGDEAGERASEISIPDLFGVRIVCAFLGDLARVEQVLSDTYEVLELERKGTEFSSREFGYESTHLLVRVPPGEYGDLELDAEPHCEIQLRTILQDAWAEVEHELVYKADNAPFEEPLKRKLAALNANLTLADLIFQEIRDYHRSLHAEMFKRRRQFWNQIQRASGLPHEHPSEDEPAEGEPPDLMDPSRLSIASDTIEAQLLRGLQAHNRQEFERAVELYTEILDSDITSHLRAIVLIHRGMAYFAMSSYDRAVADFTGTLELDDDNWKAYYYRGMVYRLRGAFGEALSDLNRCLQLDFGRFDTLFARAGVYFDMGDYQKALSDCDAALELEPDSSEARRFRKIIEARLLSEAGNWSG
ncbi:MAG: tetratricopeptide repeat protein [Spirochaetaceae bacterium]